MRTYSNMCNVELHFSKKIHIEVINMEISARNGIKGNIADVKLGEVMASIKIEVTEPGVITAIITRESAEELDLKEGDEVKAIIKSTEIMVAK